jgi:hypothetical protein
MHCPRCQLPLRDEQLTLDELPGDPYRSPGSLTTRVQLCPECSGAWLPWDSVGQKLAGCLDGESARRLAALWRWDQQTLNVDEKLRLPCPKCQQPMDKLRNRANIMILYDGCRPCQGICQKNNMILVGCKSGVAQISKPTAPRVAGARALSTLVARRPAAPTDRRRKAYSKTASPVL